MRVELDESQCKCVTSLFCYLYSRDCLASRDMTVAFRVRLPEMIDVGCCWLISSVKDGCGTYCVWRITSVDFVCFVRGVV